MARFSVFGELHTAMYVEYRKTRPGEYGREECPDGHGISRLVFTSPARGVYLWSEPCGNLTFDGPESREIGKPGPLCAYGERTYLITAGSMQQSRVIGPAALPGVS